ncbi:MAG TPA: DUF2795 domain-containing protein [Actinomycetota bacterium]|nr:DUF2795 domain-containing protein [Actinomycetota bacterium]
MSQPEITSDKVAPVVDDSRSREYSARQPHEQATSEDRHHRMPEGTLQPEEIDARTELAQSIQGSVFPATREELLASAEEMDATPEIMASLRQLPDGTYENVQEVWATLGGSIEEKRA